MKAISIRQPWAWAICHAGKRVENRGWKHAPSYRGPLLIHASAGCTRDEYEDAGDFVLDIGRARFDGLGAVDLPTLPRLADLPRGALVARASLVDIVRTTAQGHRERPGPDFDRMHCVCGALPPWIGGERWEEPCPKADPWAIPGAIGLILADVVPLPVAIPWKGALGLFDVPDEVLRGEEEHRALDAATAADMDREDAREDEL